MNTLISKHFLELHTWFVYTSVVVFLHCLKCGQKMSGDKNICSKFSDFALCIRLIFRKNELFSMLCTLRERWKNTLFCMRICYLTLFSSSRKCKIWIDSREKPLPRNSRQGKNFWNKDEENRRTRVTVILHNVYIACKFSFKFFEVCRHRTSILHRDENIWTLR